MQLILRVPIASAAPTNAFVLQNAIVHTVSGETFSPGQVLVKDGKIAAVGATVSGENATIIDLKGLHLYPGLIALNTALGLTEIGAVRSTQDTTEVGDYTPDVESWVSVNPDSELLPVARANGIALFEPVPSGGIVSGQSGLMAMDGWTSEQMVVKKPVALHVFWPAMELDTTPKEKARDKAKWKSLEEQAKERRTKLRSINDFFLEARAYSQAVAAAASGKATAPQRVPAWDAMLPFVRGELPLMVHADETRQIKAAVDWASTNGYKMVLAGARDAAMNAELLASKKIPAIYAHTFSLPARDTESYDVHFSTAETLRKAGVQVVFGLAPDSFAAGMARNLPYAAAQAVAFGLPADEAIKGLTLYPAQVTGVSDRVGSIEAGKDATIFAADGDILDIRSNVKRMWIAGKEVSLESRHSRLYEKYKARPRPSQ